ncbi:hypothetical protein EFK50_15410 [Nocardioides marmoriginsengisoli]|uniref:Uncharacterized protein n=1 Tax=Nocardioides marmoriginsengisoli TaxID=661483 RepID=A0A3N0CI00_9ACTN|nr:hypothetical protein EFK50_15410 [Nocardioides marmoriginsengisoli]
MLAGTLILALAASGCGSSPDSSHQADARSLSALVDSAPGVAAERTYGLYSSVANLAMTSKQPIRDYLPVPQLELGVVGSVAGFAEGPHYREFENDPGGRTTVMAVRVEGVLKGTVPKSRMVYAQLLGAAGPRDAAKAIPVGTAVALMLSPLDGDASVPPVNPGAGRPAGEPLWIPAAQGLIVSNGPNGGISYPRAEMSDPDVRLDDLVADDMKALHRPVVMLE